MHLKNESNWLSDCLEDVKLLSYKSFSLISELKIAVLKAGCQRFHHVWSTEFGM